MTKNISSFLPALPITKHYVPDKNQTTICKIIKLAAYLFTLPLFLLADLLYALFYCGASRPKPIVIEPKPLPKLPTPEPKPEPLPEPVPEPMPIPTPPEPEPSPVPAPPEPQPTPPPPAPAFEPLPPKVVEPVVPPPQVTSLTTRIGLAALAALGVGTLAYLIRSYAQPEDPAEPPLIETTGNEKGKLPLPEPTVEARKPLPFHLTHCLDLPKTNTTQTPPSCPDFFDKTPFSKEQFPQFKYPESRADFPRIVYPLPLSNNQCFAETDWRLMLENENARNESLQSLPVAVPENISITLEEPAAEKVALPTPTSRLIVTDGGEWEDLPLPKPSAKDAKSPLLLKAESETQDVSSPPPFNLTQYLANRQISKAETSPPTTPPTTSAPPPPPSQPASPFPWAEFAAVAGSLGIVGSALYGLYKRATGENRALPQGGGPLPSAPLPSQALPSTSFPNVVSRNPSLTAAPLQPPSSTRHSTPELDLLVIQDDRKTSQLDLHLGDMFQYFAKRRAEANSPISETGISSGKPQRTSAAIEFDSSKPQDEQLSADILKQRAAEWRRALAKTGSPFCAFGLNGPDFSTMWLDRRELDRALCAPLQDHDLTCYLEARDERRLSKQAEKLEWVHSRDLNKQVAKDAYNLYRFLSEFPDPVPQADEVPPMQPALPDSHPLVTAEPIQQDSYQATARGWLQWFSGRNKQALYEFDLEKVKPELKELVYVDGQHFYDLLNAYIRNLDHQISVQYEMVSKDGSNRRVKTVQLGCFLQDFQTPGAFVRECIPEQDSPQVKKADLWLRQLEKCLPNQFCAFRIDNETYSQIVLNVSLFTSALQGYKNDPDQQVECALYPILETDPQIVYEKVAAFLNAFESPPEIFSEQMGSDPARKAASEWEQFLTSDNDSSLPPSLFTLDPADTSDHFETMSCTIENLKLAIKQFLNRSSVNPSFLCEFQKRGSDPVSGTANLRPFLERYPNPLSCYQPTRNEATPLISDSDLDGLVKDIKLDQTSWKKYIVQNKVLFLNKKELLHALGLFKTNRSLNSSIKYYLPSNTSNFLHISLVEILPELIQQDQIKKNQVLALHQQGKTESDIQNQLGITKVSINRVIDKHNGSEEASLSAIDQFFSAPAPSTPRSRAHLPKQPVPVKRRLYELSQKGNIHFSSAVRSVLINGSSDPRNKVFVRSGGFRITNDYDSEATDPKSLPWDFDKIFAGLKDNLDVISFEGSRFDSVDDLLGRFGTSEQELRRPENQGKFDALISTLCCLTPPVAKTCETCFTEECKKIGLKIAPKEFNYLGNPNKPRINILYNQQHKTTSIAIAHTFLIGKPERDRPDLPKPVAVEAVLTFSGEHLNRLQVLPLDPSTLRSSVLASFIGTNPAKFEWLVPPEPENKTKDEELILPALGILPEAPGLWNWGLSFIPSVSTLQEYAAHWTKHISHILFHQPHLAHNHKYRIALNTEIEFLKNWLAKDSCTGEDYLHRLQVKQQQRPCPFLDNVIEAIQTLLTPSDSIRTQNSTYLYALRRALESAEYRENREEFQEINALLRGLSWARFANNWMQKYEESLIELAANRRYPKLKRSDIAGTIEEANTALYECPLDLKKAPQDGAWQKFSNSFGVYSDPIGKSNVPEVRSVHMAKRAEDEEPYPVLHLRHGTPTWQRKLFEAETIVPEYHAFLDAAAERNMNVLYVNHQKMWDSSNLETKAEWHRAKMIQALENEHNNFHFLSLPYDGRIWSDETLEIRDPIEWKETVVNALVNGTDGFSLPKGCGASMNDVFFDIANEVEEYYFPSSYLDTVEKRKIFLSIFFSYVKDVVKAKYKIQVMASPCKDDKDRGNASKGIDDAIFNVRTGLDNDNNALHRLYVRTLAPFTIKYEGIIKERLHLLLEVLNHINLLGDEGRKRIRSYTPGCTVESLPIEEEELFSTPTEIGSKLFIYPLNTDIASAIPLHQMQFKSFDTYVREACRKAGTVHLPVAQTKLLASISDPQKEVVPVQLNRVECRDFNDIINTLGITSFTQNDMNRLACLTGNALRLCDTGLDKFLRNTSPYPISGIVRERIDPPVFSSSSQGQGDWTNTLRQEYLLKFGAEQMRVHVRAVTDSQKQTQVTVFPIRNG